MIHSFTRLREPKSRNLEKKMKCSDCMKKKEATAAKTNLTNKTERWILKKRALGAIKSQSHPNLFLRWILTKISLQWQQQFHFFLALSPNDYHQHQHQHHHHLYHRHHQVVNKHLRHLKPADSMVESLTTKSEADSLSQVGWQQLHWTKQS